MKDYYKILEVSPDAPPEKIKEQWRLLLLAWHPDRFPDAKKPKAEEKTKEINEAYEVLINSARRAQYDRELSSYRERQSSASREGEQAKAREREARAQAEEALRREKAARQEAEEARRRAEEAELREKEARRQAEEAVGPPEQRDEKFVREQATHRVWINFRQDSAGFWTGSNPACQAEVESGGYSLTINLGCWHALWSRQLVISPDFVLKVKAKKVDGPDGHGFGLVFRALGQSSDESEQVWHAFCIWPNGNFGYKRLEGPKGQALYHFGGKACQQLNRGNATNEMKIVWRGNLVHIYVNEQYVVTVPELFMNEAEVGFVAVSGLHIYFTELEILATKRSSGRKGLWQRWFSR